MVKIEYSLRDGGNGGDVCLGRRGYEVVTGDYKGSNIRRVAL